jgi:hypothetical protein
MKVVEQLIRFFLDRGELTPGELKALVEKGFLKVEAGDVIQQRVRCRELPAPVEADPLDASQDRLEGIVGRKGKRPPTDLPESVKRLMRARIARLRRERGRD